MNKRIKKLWTNALRSRQYKQGQGRLRDKNNNFCCLGVLCNIYAQEHLGIARKETDKDIFLNSSFGLPLKVAQWAGFEIDILDDVGDEFNVMIGKSSAFEMNDIKNYKFYQIANQIEKNL